MADLSISGLSKTFRSHVVLNSIDFSAGSGELVAILGASGCGKTTLLRLVAGFERADEGTIVVDGRQVCGPGTHLPPERRQIGYVAQEGALFPHLTVAANVMFGLSWPSRRDRANAIALLESVGLSVAYAGRSPHELSGGEQQRVALARALAPSPKLVLLDEPFSALDSGLRVETRQAVAAALANAGATALLVTHDQSEALSMGRRVAVLRRGRLVQVATPQTLYCNPVDAELARFVGEAVILKGLVRSGTVTCTFGRLPLAIAAPDGLVDVMVRPEQIQLALDPSSSATRGRVLAVTYFGHDASIRVSLGEGAEIVVTRVPGRAAPAPGAEVWLKIEDAVMVYANSAGSYDGRDR